MLANHAPNAATELNISWALCSGIPLTVSSALPASQTSSVLARHAGDVLEYDAHNLYGLAEARVTAAAIRLIKGTRPFILTRCCVRFRGQPLTLH